MRQPCIFTVIVITNKNNDVVTPPSPALIDSHFGGTAVDVRQSSNECRQDCGFKVSGRCISVITSIVTFVLELVPEWILAQCLQGSLNWFAGNELFDFDTIGHGSRFVAGQSPFGMAPVVKFTRSVPFRSTTRWAWNKMKQFLNFAGAVLNTGCWQSDIRSSLTECRSNAARDFFFLAPSQSVCWASQEFPPNERNIGKFCRHRFQLSLCRMFVAALRRFGARR